MKLLIVGGPRAGKTTKARELLDQLRDTDTLLMSTDSLIPTHTWSEMSDAVCKLLEQDGNWIIEGAAGVRGLRKWLSKHPGKPPFEILYMNEPKVQRTAGQHGMAKGVETMWRECLDLMRGRT